MDKQVLNAQKRAVTGRKVKTLRSQGQLPGNIYGKKIQSLAIVVKNTDFLQVYKKAGETNLITLAIKDGKTDKKGKLDERAVLISNVQKDPVGDNPIHVDFRQVDLKEKVTAQVPVEIQGESPAEKQGLGTVVQYVNVIEVEALPTDLPDKFIVDVAKLEAVDAAVSVKDLPVDKDKIELKIDPETILVKVEPPQKEEEIAPPPTEEVAPEAAAPTEGEAVSTQEAPAEETNQKAEKPQ